MCIRDRVYSTCTFSPEENEGVVSRFLECCKDFEIEKISADKRFSRGRPDWAVLPAKGIEDTFRLWPHRLRGEGHYIAVLRKNGEGFGAIIREEGKRGDLPPEYKCFAAETLRSFELTRPVLFGEQLYSVPEGTPELSGLRILRPGLHAGTLRPGRFHPSHALALALRTEQAVNHVRLSGNSPEAEAYRRGEVLPGSGPKGWYLIEIDGYSIGWGKLSGGILKNHYPKGLRRMD